MPRPSSLTRRELIALAGVGAGILILGEGVLASEAMSGPASLARAGSSESSDSTEAGVTENPKAAASERSPEDAAASPEEVADSAAKASMGLEDLPPCPILRRSSTATPWTRVSATIWPHF